MEKVIQFSLAPRRFFSGRFFFGILALTGNLTLQAQSISIPNHSFELPDTSAVDINIDSWQKADRPGYFPEAGYTIEGFGTIYWVQTAGVFLDTNPYANREGTQAAFMLSFPQAGLYQDLSTLNAQYAVGQAYNFSLGIFGKNMTPGSQLQLSFYYRDSGNAMIPVGTPTTVVFTTAEFPTTPPLNFNDYQVTTPIVQASDPWAGKNIGLKIESAFGYGDGYWDLDNARLTAVPEPSSIVLLALSVSGLLAKRRLRP